jgi:hypothetical protein
LNWQGDARLLKEAFSTASVKMGIGAFSAPGPLFPYFQTFAVEPDGLEWICEVGRLLVVEIGSMPTATKFVLYAPTYVLCPQSQLAETLNVDGSPTGRLSTKFTDRSYMRISAVK